MIEVSLLSAWQLSLQAKSSALCFVRPSFVKGEIVWSLYMVPATPSKIMCRVTLLILLGFLKLRDWSLVIPSVCMLVFSNLQARCGVSIWAVFQLYEMDVCHALEFAWDQDVWAFL